MFWHWIRRRYRMIAKPLLPEKEANKWHNISSGAYFLLCWTLFGYLLFKHGNSNSQGSSETSSSTAEYYGSLLGAEKMDVIHLKGFRYVGESVFELKDYKEKRKHQNDKKDNEFFGCDETEAQ